MRRYPGEVWYLPPDALEGGDPKGRRHVLLTPCDDTGDIGVFAYASTQATEAHFGAAALLVDPAAGRYGHTGFSKPTYIYPSRLIPAASEDFQRLTGRLIDEMPELRRCLQEALGFGTGTSSGRGSAAGSWRGRIVELTTTVSEQIGFALGVIISEPAYSMRKRYQVIIPVGDLRTLTPAAGDLVVTTGDWFRGIFTEPTEILFAVADVQSVFHPVEVAGWTVGVVDGDTVERIETELARLFVLR